MPNTLIKTQATRFVSSPVTPPPTKVVLEMREEVAETLVMILNSVGGPREGRRGHSGEVLSALFEAGVRVYTSDKCLGYKDSIYFGPKVTR